MAVINEYVQIPLTPANAKLLIWKINITFFFFFNIIQRIYTDKNECFMVYGIFFKAS